MTQKLGVFIKSASRKPVIEYYRLIRDEFLPKNKLIAKCNPLGKDAIKAIKKDGDQTSSFSLRPRDVNTYISASAISHVLDGWGYLANSINAFLRGNSGIAIHLAYYAELRAVMAFLASEGVGVFDSRHLAIDSFDSFLTFKKWTRIVDDHNPNNPNDRRLHTGYVGTHVFAWEALNKWCQSKVKESEHIVKVFQVKGHRFDEFISWFHPRARPHFTSGIIKKWLRSWAFDVRKYRNDRDLRNFASYRPQLMSEFDYRFDIEEASKTIFEFFSVISPSATTSFKQLDLLLLKAIFDELYELPIISGDGYSKEELIKRAYENLGLSLSRYEKDVFLRNEPFHQLHQIFTTAQSKKKSCLPMISRGILLLRTATGCVATGLNEASIKKEDLSFVFKNYGENNGFWDDVASITEYSDLWADVDTKWAEALDQIQTTKNNLYSYNKDISSAVALLSQINRAALWGLDYKS